MRPTDMESEPESLDKTTVTPSHGAACATGGCGGRGLCPGIAILLAYLVGSGILLLTGLNWLGWVFGIVTAIVLISGAWRFLPRRRSGGSRQERRKLT